MGEQAFGLSGFTGHHLAIDPERGLFSLFLGDRVLNRLAVLRPPAGDDPYGFWPGRGWVWLPGVG